MRRLILLGLFLAAVLPAHAGKHLTVAQLEQTLAADFASHRTDDQIAHKLDDLDLSERLTETALDRLGASLSPGPKTALALVSGTRRFYRDDWSCRGTMRSRDHWWTERPTM